MPETLHVLSDHERGRNEPSLVVTGRVLTGATAGRVRQSLERERVPSGDRLSGSQYGQSVICGGPPAGSSPKFSNSLLSKGT